MQQLRHKLGARRACQHRQRFDGAKMNGKSLGMFQVVNWDAVRDVGNHVRYHVWLWDSQLRFMS